MPLSAAHLTRKSFTALFVIAASAILSFVSHIILARLLPTAEFGIYILSLAWLHILVMIGCLGFNTASMKFIPQLTDHVQPYLRYAGSRSFTASILIAVLFLFILILIKPIMDDTSFMCLAITCLLIPIRSYGQMSLASLRATQHIFLAQLPDGIIRPLLFLLSLLALSSLTTLSVVEAIILSLLLHILVAFIYFKLIKRFVKKDLVLSAEPADTPTISLKDTHKAWLRTALSLMSVSVLMLTLQKADLIVLRLFEDPRSTGIYAAVTTLISLFFMGYNALAIALSPLISPLDSFKDQAKLQQLFNRARLLQFMGFGTGFLIIYFFGYDILKIYGIAYTQGFSALLLLSGFFLLSSVFGPSMMFALIRGQHMHSIIVVLGAALLNLTMLMVFIPIYGMIGAALATGTGWCLMHGGFYFLFKKNHARVLT